MTHESLFTPAGDKITDHVRCGSTVDGLAPHPIRSKQSNSLGTGRSTTTPSSEAEMGSIRSPVRGEGLGALENPSPVVFPIHRMCKRRYGGLNA